jgi:hypothetical protein
LDNDPVGQVDRVRAPGGGRKKAEVADPELLDRLESLIEPGRILQRAAAVTRLVSLKSK